MPSSVTDHLLSPLPGQIVVLPVEEESAMRGRPKAIYSSHCITSPARGLSSFQKRQRDLYTAILMDYSLIRDGGSSPLLRLSSNIPPTPGGSLDNSTSPSSNTSSEPNSGNTRHVRLSSFMTRISSFLRTSFGWPTPIPSSPSEWVSTSGDLSGKK